MHPQRLGASPPQNNSRLHDDDGGGGDELARGRGCVRGCGHGDGP